MKILITGGCGFVGSTIARALVEHDSTHEILALDNLIRPGSELNRESLQRAGVKVVHADIRAASDVEALPAIDWIIDAAANPSVLAGVDGTTSSRQLVEHNLFGTVNLLELAKRSRAGLILLSTSRVYSIAPLADLTVREEGGAYRPSPDQKWPRGLSANGIAENFTTASPVSLYGSTKLASECLALEYGNAFDFPVWINRCGVLAGAGQFGRVDQGVFAYWINSYLRRRPLKYVGFGGCGLQTRDVLHPRDLMPLLRNQMTTHRETTPIVNVGGGVKNARSLAQLSAWCAARFGEHAVGFDETPRAFDLPWIVIDSRLAEETWNWKPATSAEEIFEEIAAHAEQHPEWLEISSPR